jgi:O-antigen/teichoic acid export membrane protein
MSKISKFCVAAVILFPVLAVADGSYRGGGNVKSAAVQNTVVTSASGGGTAVAGGLGIAYAGRTPIPPAIGVRPA